MSLIYYMAPIIQLLGEGGNSKLKIIIKMIATIIMIKFINLNTHKCAILRAQKCNNKKYIYLNKHICMKKDFLIEFWHFCNVESKPFLTFTTKTYCY